MGIVLFIKGFIISFIVAAPVGPVGILNLRRMLTYGPSLGLASALGGALADVFYAAIVAFSLTFVSDFLIFYRFPLRLMGTIFLLVYAIKILIKPSDLHRPIGDANHLHALSSTLFLTLSNPAFAIIYTTAFAAVGIVARHGHWQRGSGILLVAGVLFGSMAWWIGLALLYPAIKRRLSTKVIRLINTLTGVIIIFITIFSFFSLAL